MTSVYTDQNYQPPCTDCPRCSGTGLTGKLHHPALSYAKIFGIPIKAIVVERTCGKCKGTGQISDLARAYQVLLKDQPERTVTNGKS